METCPSTSVSCTPILAFLSLVMSVINDGLQREQQHQSPPPQDFDVIIVGGGSAGCVLAARLSELPDVAVLLLERGGSEPELAHVPGLIIPNLRSDIVQQLTAVAEPQNCNASGCLVQVPQVLGGGSAVNGMMYVRGSDQDYDKWGEGWSFREVLPYFKRAENNLNPEIASDTEFHGTGGPQPVSWMNYQHPTLFSLMDSFAELGLDMKDINGPSQLGYSLVQTTTAFGERWSTNRGYLAPARHRPNLWVETFATAQRILFNEESPPRAIGVEYEDAAGKVRVASARREVVLTAGALHSPHVLLRSGVGPASHLQEAGIPVVADLAGVGEGLMDHPTTRGFEFVCRPPYCCGDAVSRDGDIVRYDSARGGPLSAAGPVQVTAFHRTPVQTEPGHIPDLQSVFLGSFALDNGTRCTLLDAWRFNRIIYSPVVLHPESRGWVRLNTSAPSAEPRVRFGYLTADHDVRVIVEGLKLGMRLAGPLERRGLELDRTPRPGCQHLYFGSDEYFECLARRNTATIWHYSGSCRMGPAGDPGAVTDQRLRVHGVVGLRVGDASIMPTLISGNLNAPVIMIAEKLSDLIKEDLSIIRGQGAEGSSR